MYKVGIQVVDREVINRELCLKFIIIIRKNNITKKNLSMSNIKQSIRNENIVEFSDFTGLTHCLQLDTIWNELNYFLEKIDLRENQYQLYKLVGGQWKKIKDKERFYISSKNIINEIRSYRLKIMEKEHRLYGEVTSMKLFRDKEILKEEEKYDMGKIINIFPSISPADDIKILIEKILIIYPNRDFLYEDLASDIKSYFKYNKST